MCEPGKKKGCRQKICEERMKLLKDWVVAKDGVDMWESAPKGINSLGHELKRDHPSSDEGDSDEDPENNRPSLDDSF